MDDNLWLMFPVGTLQHNNWYTDNKQDSYTSIWNPCYKLIGGQVLACSYLSV